MKVEVSLIIPCLNSEDGLNKLLTNIITWSIFPAEILVIDSSTIKPNVSKNFSDFCDYQNIALKVIEKNNLYPGKARNIGIQSSSYPALAFLDIATIPSQIWLEFAWKELTEKKIDGIWGSTVYEANSWFQNIIRAVTYGNLPITTLPGSLIYSKVFETSGLFIGSTRAGEDADWMSRVGLHDFKFIKSTEHTTYNGLTEMTFIGLIKKWYRNYLFSAKLPYLNAHKDIYFYFVAFFLMAVAFNWNNLSYDYSISGWNTDSFAYIPNITKVSILFFTSLYISARCIYLPFRKGVSLSFLFLNMPAIILLSIILDTVKATAFFHARFFQVK